MSSDTPAPAASPLPALLLLLSVTTGLVDAATVLGLGKVFSANMTGNLVFAAFAAVSTPGFRLAPHLTALLAFVLGALFAGRFGKYYLARPLRRWLFASATIETAILWIAAGVACHFAVSTQTPSWRLHAIIALTAAAMGFRNGTIHQLKAADLTTTLVTMTITGLSADSSLAGGGNPNWRRRLAGVIAIFVGAVTGALVVRRFGLAVALGAAGALVLAGTLFCIRHPSVPA